MPETTSPRKKKRPVISIPLVEALAASVPNRVIKTWLGLYAHAGVDTSVCNPSISTLAKETQTNRSHVHKDIKTLEQKGWLVVHRKPGSGNRYEITTPPGMGEKKQEPEAEQETETETRPASAPPGEPVTETATVDQADPSAELSPKRQQTCNRNGNTPVTETATRTEQGPTGGLTGGSKKRDRGKAAESPSSPDDDEPSKAPEPSGRYSADFETWWKHWPGEGDQKYHSSQLYELAITRLTIEEGWNEQQAVAFLLERVKLYAQSDIGQRPPDMIPRAPRFFGERMYLDDPATWNKRKGNGNGHQANGRKKTAGQKVQQNQSVLDEFGVDLHEVLGGEPEAGSDTIDVQFDRIERVEVLGMTSGI